MVFKRNKSGQAAIEFLMTYGWMLLVVLIVGALIFSFVDFGSLLPAKLDLSNNLRGDPTGSIAYSATSTTSSDQNQVKVVFRYNGARKAVISPKDATIKTELGSTCYGIQLQNLDTKANVNASSIDVGTLVYTFSTSSKDTPFLNGHDGLMTFDCNDNSTGGNGVTYTGGSHGVTGGLLAGDTISGTISIPVKDPKTSLAIPSTGSIRLSVSG